MDVSYQEKRIWLNLLAEAVVYALYFGRVGMGGFSISAMVWLVVSMVIIQVILQTVLALTSRREAMDERDRAIEGIAFRVAYFVLVISLVTTIAVMWSLQATGVSHAGFLVTPVSGFFSINLILLALFAAEVSKLISQLVQYRMSA